MKLAIRPIRYTANLTQMQEWASALGMAPLLVSDSWVVLGAGQGKLALHAVPDGDPLAGTTTLAVETDDLDALDQLWSGAGMVTRRIDEHGIPLLFASTPFGGEIAAGEWSGSIPDGVPDPGLIVMPMLVARDVPAAADWFVGWGLERRISSEGGGWTDLAVPASGGLVAIHGIDSLEADPPQQSVETSDGGMREVVVWLTFEHPDVDGALERVRAAGLDARVHDEAYNRTLLVRCPDGDEIWVNGVMSDLYGYQRD